MPRRTTTWARPCKDQGKLDEAVACYRRALELKPDFAEAHNNLGVALQDQGQLDEAVACYRRALELKPRLRRGPQQPGQCAARTRGSSDEAVACYRRALELKPDFAEAHSNLGNAFKDQGRLDEAIACYRRALELKPDLAEVHSNLVYAQIFCPGYDAQTLYEEHRRWNQQPRRALGEVHPAASATTVRPIAACGSAMSRRDFRDHVVGRNLLPLFREHDHQRFEIFCYADVPRHDELTGRFRGYADAWRDTAGLTDAQLAQRIREDRIDILVDLTLHMAHNRLLVFARKPAPVQVTFAGYPGTTGLATIDYRLTDPYLDPPGLYDALLLRGIDPLAGLLLVLRSAGQRSRRSTPCRPRRRGMSPSGASTTSARSTRCVLKLWARVLKAVDRSRLTILAGEGSHRQQTLDLLARGRRCAAIA